MLEWKPDYSVGVARIDAQHRKLFDYVNELESAMRQGQGRQVISKVLRNLAAYTKEHFAAEEGLMRKAEYPDLARHKAVHDGFVAQVAEFERRHEAGELSVTVEVVSWLGDWVRNHVLKMDQQYAPHLASRKVA